MEPIEKDIAYLINLLQGNDPKPDINAQNKVRITFEKIIERYGIKGTNEVYALAHLIGKKIPNDENSTIINFSSYGNKVTPFFKTHNRAQKLYPEPSYSFKETIDLSLFREGIDDLLSTIREGNDEYFLIWNTNYIASNYAISLGVNDLAKGIFVKNQNFHLTPKDEIAKLRKIKTIDNIFSESVLRFMIRNYGVFENLNKNDPDQVIYHTISSLPLIMSQKRYLDSEGYDTEIYIGTNNHTITGDFYIIAFKRHA